MTQTTAELGFSAGGLNGWQIETCDTCSSGRGDLAAARRAGLLSQGWEPFAVAEGLIWFRRKIVNGVYAL